MTYRRLTREELDELKPEFIRFLAANSIPAPDWEKMKVESPAKADEFLVLFSDVVFERILQKVEYLEYRSPRDIKTFHCQDDKICLLGVRVEGDTGLDFTQNLSPQQMMRQMQLSRAGLQLYSAEKKYSKKREEELFDLMESGALIAKDGGMYKVLEQLKPGKQQS